MATVFTETFEGGSNGNTITTGNTNYDSVSGAPTFTNSSPAVGSLAADCDASGSTCRFDEAVDEPSVLYRRFYFKVPELPGSNLYIATNTSGASARADMRINTNGTVSVRNGFSAVWTSTAAVTAGQWARFEWRLSATAGTQEARLFTGAQLHGPSNNPTDSSGSVTFDAGTFTNTGVGIIQNTTARVFIDDVKNDDSTWPGPATVPNQAPIVTYPANTQMPGVVDAEKSITATATDPDGSVVAWDWSWNTVVTPSGEQPDLTGETTATVKFTPTEGGTYGLRVRAQDDDDAWSDYAYVTVAVPATVGTVIDLGTGDWTEHGGTGVGILSDSNDATYYQADSVFATASTQEFVLSPAVNPAAFSINVRHFLTASIGGYANATLLEGSTIRKSWSLSPTTTPTTTTLTLSATDVESISDWSNLRLRLSWQEN